VLRTAVLVVTLVGLSVTLFTLIVGPWRISVAGVVFRITDLSRALSLTVVCGGAWLLLTERTRQALRHRSLLVFYVATTVAMALFSCGPVLRVGGVVVFHAAAYRWLMYLPGFNALRDPTRFWMLGILCLTTAAGLSLASLPLSRQWVRRMVFGLATMGVLLDGWVSAVPMAVAPERWPKVERRDQPQPILELPLGPRWDAAATFRSIWHRRPVVNGVSGYDPPHYAPLQAGLNAHDPGMLLALASLGSFDAVVNAVDDPTGAWARYVSSIAGVVPIASDGRRTAYRVPRTAIDDAVVGAVLPIARVEAFLREATSMSDGRLDTEWGDDPQRPGQWVLADLGEVHEVGGLTHALGEYARDFPRLLAIELSRDGSTWEQVWQGPTAALAFLAAVRSPRGAVMRFQFTPRPARFVRLQQLAHHRNMWRVAELQVHAPQK
jgi:hypothetical protein